MSLEYMLSTPMGVPATPAQRAAVATLEHLGYTYHGGELWKPPLGPHRLKDAATDLLEALQGMVNWYGRRTHGQYTLLPAEDQLPEVRLAMQAIEKATIASPISSATGANHV